MRLRKRAVVTCVLVAIVWAGEVLFTEAVYPRQVTQQAIAAVNGSEREAMTLRAYQRFSDAAMFCAALLSLGIVVVGLCGPSAVKEMS